MKLKVTVNGVAYSIEVDVEEPERPQLGQIVFGGPSAQPAQSTASIEAVPANAVTAPLSGSVSRILVEVGQQIDAGQVLLVLEAMKMETEITAPHAGVVDVILVEKGEAVAGGEALLRLT
jgi:methylmalonyl-CoA carboxyltransferase small subunit